MHHNHTGKVTRKKKRIIIRRAAERGYGPWLT